MLHQIKKEVPMASTMKRSFLPKLNLARRARNMDKGGWRIAMCCRRPISILLATVALFVAASSVQAQSQYITPDGSGDITFTPGLRLQSRYTYDDENGNHDIFIRRTRLKAKGEAFDVARYYAEIKIDSVGRFEKDPKAQVENAWLDFTVMPELALRVGLYDVPFSRNALTSDSKQLLMDRSLIKGALADLGLADNTIGVLGHGRPFGGHFEYSVGIFDNEKFEKSGTTATKQSDKLMPAGRIVFHLLDPAKPLGYADYRGSYLGQGQRLSIGANSGYLSKARDGVNEFDLFGWGVDLFFNTGSFTLEAEYDRFMEDMSGGNPDIEGDGWYVQAGYLLRPAIELAARYQELDADRSVSDNRLQWTSVGLNIYIREHNLKIQTDYTFKREQGSDVENDMFQIQLQLDY
jgi:phosphate-selective porin